MPTITPAMNFSVTPGLGVGTGQPTRSDFESTAHQDRLRPGNQLDIPKQTVGGTHTKAQLRDEDPKKTGWQLQDDALDVGHQQMDASASWNRFSGDRARGWGGLNRGSVQVDSPNLQPLGTQFQSSKPAADWVTHAAQFEERFRQDGEKFGINAELRLPGEGPQRGGPPGPGAKTPRRTFTLG